MLFCVASLEYFVAESAMAEEDEVMKESERHQTFQTSNFLGHSAPLEHIDVVRKIHTRIKRRVTIANSGQEVMEAEENEDCLGDEEDAEAGWEAG